MITGLTLGFGISLVGMGLLIAVVEVVLWLGRRRAMTTRAR